MKLYRFSPIESQAELWDAIRYTHVACYQLCKQSFGTYFPNAGNIGIFTHYESEFVALHSIWKKLTKPSDDPNRKYFELIEPIVIPSQRGVPETRYTYLYIRRPDPYRAQVGDIDFYVAPEEYRLLKQQLQNGIPISGARIFDRPDLDMVELYNPAIDALGYVSTDTMVTTVRTKQSALTKL